MAFEPNGVSSYQEPPAKRPPSGWVILAPAEVLLALSAASREPVLAEGPDAWARATASGTEVAFDRAIVSEMKRAFAEKSVLLLLRPLQAAGSGLRDDQSG